VPGSSAVHRYHDGTKHHFNRFARSLGYLDWASQPSPLRRFAGAPTFALAPRPDRLAGDAQAEAIGDILRHAFGLSAWKQFRDSRWSLRVNPSSGNLHPTEAVVVCGGGAGLAGGPAVYHYAADRHELELRCAFERGPWASAAGGGEVVLVALSSIHWREAWKYGERAFRYCQHDLGHAVAALSIAAAMAGWHATIVPAWSHAQIAAIAGLDRDEDFVDAEREEPGCLVALTRGAVPSAIWQPGAALIAAVAAGAWHGRASRLSEDHVQWTFIDEIAGATRDAGRLVPHAPPAAVNPLRGIDRRLVLQRRSAVALDGMSATDRHTFLGMLSSVMPRAGAPWDALWWAPRIHLAIFVHRVEGVDAGLYALLRDEEALGRVRQAAGRDFLWERADDRLPLFCLARGDCRPLARRLSCDQDIAADGFFSLGMIAEFDGSLEASGPSCYRRLFWETGVIGQVLYLEAEAAGARATGIGCFYDDPVHDVLGLRGHAFQSLYHFTVGIPVEDGRLTSAPGYAWG
jgi:SagB-type dehydrogenase family enzyme